MIPTSTPTDGHYLEDIMKDAVLINVEIENLFALVGMSADMRHEDDERMVKRSSA